MGKKQPTNENIRIGGIYKESFRDECGSSCAFYQVVGKRAKTLVELRFICDECFVDEACNLGLGQVRVRPLPGQFLEKCPAFTARAAYPSSVDGRQWLYWHDKECDFTHYFREVREGETGMLTGYDGFYALDEMKKEGKLPPWYKK